MRRTHHGCTLLQGVSWSVSWGWTHWETRTPVQLLPPAWCHRAAWFFARQKKKKVFCSGKEQLVLCQGQNEGKEHRVWQGGDELSPIRIFFFMHPFHSMAGANLSGGFHDPAKAPALGGIFLVAPVPVLAELIQRKITLQMCFVLGQISPMCWLFAWPETVPGAREEAVSQGLGRQVLPWQN